MKKTLFLFLVLTIFFSICGCSGSPSPIASESPTATTATPAPTPTPPITTPPPSDIPVETIQTSSLSQYVIVYPSEYETWQMTEIYILQDAIEHITGTKISAVPDTSAKSEHEIILASSNRNTALDEHIKAFESRLDYLIAVSDGNIILGGQDYYGNMKAAYDFINNYLGYDDINNVYSTPQSKITGVSKTVYDEPDFTIGCGNFYKNKYPSAQSVKDVADAHFNLFIIQGLANAYDENTDAEEFRQLLNWCARFNLRAVLPMRVNEETVTFELPFLSVYENNPIVWGHYIKDEPMITVLSIYSQIADQYKLLYGNKGWKSVINHLGNVSYLRDYLEETSGVFDSTDVLSFDFYFAHGNRVGDDEVNNRHNVFNIWEQYGAIAERNEQEFWSYIMAYYLDNYNSGKMLRWSSYISMCFGVDAILYFNYQVWIVDNKYNKLEHWYNAQYANADIAFVGETLQDNYNYAGTFTLNRQTSDDFTYLENFYTGFDDVITDVILPETNSSPYVVGCYDKKDGDGNAFLLVNMDELDYIPYDETSAVPIKIKINGENVKFYREGSLYEIEKDSDGYYGIEAGNGHCWFVTVD